MVDCLPPVSQKHLTRDVPRIERCGFRWDVVNDRQSLEQFHDLQYAPLMADRHGEAGVLVSRDWLLDHRNPSVVSASGGDQWVASAFVSGSLTTN